ncbi:MAG TPA: peptidylprolyl isomerase [Vicinamibacterales bacterium]|nr:peptidylprolyl isomerase [Vicinamibacterales bacterium]
MPRQSLFVAVLSLVLLTSPVLAQRRGAPAPATQNPATALFTTPLSAAEMTNKQAVVNTTAGTIVIDLRPDLAPNHVGYFMKLAREHAFDGTAFHRVIRMAIIQGGDPLSKDPAKRSLYGTGGLGMLKAEFSAEPATRGAVAAVLQPNKLDSAGSQFFICVTDQVALNGKYTIFGRVAEGMDVAQKISETAADAENRPTERIVITDVAIRETPPPEPEPFAGDPPTALAQYRAALETSLGTITVEFFPDRAPEHVRNFLRLAETGVYDGTAFHRVVRGFVVQTGALTSRAPLTEKQRKYVHTLKPEFSETPHVKGILSMARGDDPASATTSFFIVTGNASSLDGKYTVFGRVVEGLPVVDAIEQAPVNGETPVTRIELTRVRIIRP